MANSTLVQYDPGLIIVNIGGKNITGFAADTFVEFEREVDAFSKTVGADGEVTRVKSQNMSGSLKLTLQQGSPGNDILSTLATQDEMTSDAVFPVLVKDAGGTTLIQGAKAWIKKKANATFAAEAGNREWTIDIAQALFNLGGNTIL